jgi:hypothetical protein
MEIVNVNGRENQVFILGGRRFLCPVRLGAGYTDSIGQAQIDLMMEDDEFVKKLSNLNTKNQEQATKEITQITSEYAIKHPVDYKVAILTALLTPEDGNHMSAEEFRLFYMEDVTPAERDAVLGFFTKSLTVSQNGVPSKMRRGNTITEKKRKTR